MKHKDKGKITNPSGRNGEPVPLRPHETIGENHPLASILGVFDDEPLWDEWMASIAEYRQEVTASELEE